MNIAHLKSKILDLAVRGKLTEQRPEEGSAEELLERIREEKQRLIAEGKLKKEKPLPDITEEDIPFDIPAGWKWVRLGEICEVIMGQSPDGSSITTSSDGIEFHQGKICFTNKFLTQSSIKTFEATRIAVSGSVLLCVRAPVGVVNITLRDICIGRGLCSIYPHYTIEPEFWFYWLKSQKEYFEMKATGTTFKAITINVVRQHCIPLPPLAEQKRIVEKIEAIFEQADIIEESRLALKTAVRHTKSRVLDLAVRGKLTEQRPEEGSAEELLERIREEKQCLIAEGKLKKEKPLPEITADEIPFEIPASWEWCRLGKLAESIQYGFNAPAKVYGRIRMVRISDIQNGRISWETVPYCDITEEEIPNYLLKRNDILFARTGGTVGKSYIVKEIPENSIYAGYLIRTRFSNFLCSDYLKYFMESPLYWTQLKNGVMATAQPNCNGETLSRMFVPLPSFAEQKRIVEKIEQIFTALDIIEKAVEG